jgi:hypothetical protein
MDKVPERRPFLEAIEQRRLRRHGERRRRAVASDARTTTYVGVIFRCVRSAPGVRLPARVLERGDDDAAAHAAAKAVADVDIVVGIARARAPCGAEGTDDAYRDDRDWQKTRLTAGTRAAESQCA